MRYAMVIIGLRRFAQEVAKADLAHNQAGALKGLVSRLHQQKVHLDSGPSPWMCVVSEVNFIIREAKKTLNARVEWLGQLKVAWRSLGGG